MQTCQQSFLPFAGGAFFKICRTNQGDQTSYQLQRVGIGIAESLKRHNELLLVVVGFANALPEKICDTLKHKILVNS